MENKIYEIKKLLNVRRFIDAKLEIDELGKEIGELKKYKEAVSKLKKKIREKGRTDHIKIQEIEEVLKELK